MKVLERVNVTAEGGSGWRFPGQGEVRRARVAAGVAARARRLGRDYHWSTPRDNLLVDRLDLPQQPGTRLRTGPVLLEITQECDPCSRIEEIQPGLKAAVTPSWRGGALAKVVEGGNLALGDTMRIEQ